MKTRVTVLHRHLHLFLPMCKLLLSVQCVCTCLYVCGQCCASRPRKVMGASSRNSKCLVSQSGHLAHSKSMSSVFCTGGGVSVCMCVSYHTSVIPMLNLRSECSSVVSEVCNVIIKLLLSSLSNKYGFCDVRTSECKNRTEGKMQTLLETTESAVCPIVTVLYRSSIIRHG